MPCLHPSETNAQRTEAAKARRRRRMDGRWVTTRAPFGKGPPGYTKLGYVPLMRPLIPLRRAVVASLVILLTSTASSGAADPTEKAPPKAPPKAPKKAGP